MKRLGFVMIKEAFLTNRILTAFYFFCIKSVAEDSLKTVFFKEPFFCVNI